MATLRQKFTEEEEKNLPEEVETINTMGLADDDTEEVFEMLAGYEDENGTIHKTFTLREMTGRDEEAINKADIKANASKLISTLLSRCVTSIGTLKPDMGKFKWDNVIKNLLVGDQDFMMLQLRAISLGEDISFENICPNCKTKLKTVMRFDELPIIPFKGKRILSFELPSGYKDKRGKHTEGKIRTANGFDREVLIPVARINTSKADTLMLTRLCSFDDGTNVDDDVMASLTVKDRKYLQELMKENLFGIDFETEITCDNCGEIFVTSLNSINFI